MHPGDDVLTTCGDGVLRVTWNRPDALNALTDDMLVRAAEVIEAAATDRAVRVIVLAGEGRAFSSGADLGSSPDDAPVGEATLDAANRLVRAVRAVPKPVVAAVHGPAVGFGASAALAADVTVAAESAYFLLAFTAVGLMPDGGATALVPAAVGRARATRMALLGERVDANTALGWGLVTMSVPDDRFPDDVRRLVEKLAQGPTAAYARLKRALDTAALATLEPALRTERTGQLELFGTRDFAEGTAAFREKRTPRFLGE